MQQTQYDLSQQFFSPELTYYGDVMWMMVTSKKLEPYMDDAKSPSTGLHVIYPVDRFEPFHGAEGSTPQYEDDPEAAKLYHEKMVRFFWWTYDDAMVRKEQVEPLSACGGRVADRLRMQALGSPRSPLKCSSCHPADMNVGRAANTNSRPAKGRIDKVSQRFFGLFSRPKAASSY